MVALFLDDNKTNDGGKNNMFILTNKPFTRAHAILYISLPSFHHYDMKLYGVGEHNTKIVAFFV